MFNVLGVNIHNYTKEKIREKLDGFLDGNKPNQIVTVNSEFILNAQDDEEFFYILNHAKLSLSDGVSLFFAGLCLFHFIHRATGVWLVQELLKNKKIKKTLIINWDKGLQNAEGLKEKLKNKFPNSLFLILDSPRKDLELDWQQINDFKPQLILSSLGSPWQEKLLYSNKNKFTSAKILVGVGGALDYINKKVKRAPKFMRVLGLEWLYRLVKQPQRIKRIYNATFQFVFKFIKWRFILPFKYRQNVACMLYKKEGDEIKIFMVERTDEPGHWQIPQGGLGKLNIKEAGLKELREETGSNNIKYMSHTKFIHKYKFPFNVNRHRGAIYHRFTGYKGQKQALLIAEYKGNDNDIKISHWDHSAWKWVDLSDVVNVAHAVRKESMKKFVKIFNSAINK